jgi:hypothetical protein
MFASAKNRMETGILPLSSAVFCLDCEVISNSRSDECAHCQSRSIMSLDRILGGSLLAHKLKQERESWFFDITIAIELRQMHAKDLSTTVERLAGVIGPALARDRASFRINVNPARGALDLQPSLCFPERDAA